ncbi:RNA polymerase sigma factor, sigma-70 family [Streptomyces sp. 2112.3]|uniref:sigma-70 family RNA polymerase sigma factor n=1 Tax=Streptomyces sp. 2112.3 TaxID=1881023 RepID=UPI00089AE75B|nr:sigma-70 family RNA polymerase sigma factor [Streptomyces sp. 2112.3]SEF14629.1 RNA polymerase sigma factor, sigma-70 family [Streptomyces sp. 2112.3]
MGVKQENGTAAVEAAKAGDEHAREELIASYLPLIYNVVGRALDGHADVDDVVQETMLRVLESLSDLREPASFRSWLVAIAMNQVRRRWTADRKAPVVGWDQAPERADRAADFVDLTILKLGLSGQRREVAAATRWLDEGDRSLLSLWWLEAAGEITRPELVAAVGIDSRHAAVRVQRMKEQLEAGRVVVRALSASPPCPDLAQVTATWDNEPCALWRKRISRHARRCAACSGHWNDLVPAEGLLAGLALLPLPAHLAPPAALAPTAATATATAAPAHHVSGASGVPGASEAPGASGAPGVPGASGVPGAHPLPKRLPRPRRVKKGTVVTGTATLAVAVTAALWWSPGTPPAERKDAGRDEPKAARTAPSPPPTPDPTPTPTPTHTPSPTRTATASPTPSARPAPAAPSLEEQATSLINRRRDRAGCGPLHIDRRLHTAARRHSADMAARQYYEHNAPDGTGPDERITAAGYQWSSWGENLDRGPRTAAAAVNDWMGDAMHRDNLLNCTFTSVGIGVVQGAGGPWWTQDLAAPR